MKLKPNKMQQTLGFRVREPVDWEEVKGLLDQLYAASGRLEALFPGRKFTLDGHLVGSVGEVIAAYLFDRLENGLSAVYSFFDPDLGRRSLGTYMVLWLIETARAAGLPYVYLGYWIRDAPKMAYKSRFRPLEALGPDGWRIVRD